MGSETKMDRAIFKKNIHFSQKEELHCAQMIIDGADLHRVSEWHKLRFGKPMSESKFYRKRKMAAQIVVESKNKKPTPARAYTRPNEGEMQIFENHLKNAIVERTESLNAIKWTYPLLKTFAEAERQKPEFLGMESVQKYKFSSSYWMSNQFMARTELCFSKRKSDQQNIPAPELQRLRDQMNQKLMFYKSTDVINVDESGVFWRMSHGRIITKKGIRIIKSLIHIHECF